jgi:hypothetical protein
MFACTVTGDPKHPVVKLSGSLTLEHSKEIHAQLLAHLPKAQGLTFDLGESDKSDLSFIQILCAVMKDQDRTIRFLHLPAHLLESAASLGADSFIKEITHRIEENI